jgi:uncharacterized protein (DUF362 family)
MQNRYFTRKLFIVNTHIEIILFAKSAIKERITAIMSQVAQVHSPSTDKSVVDICRYKKPNLSIVDTSVALTGMHLAGTPKKLGLILASFDPVAVDTVATALLGHNPKNLPYLTFSKGLLGTMDNIELLTG